MVPELLHGKGRVGRPRPISDVAQRSSVARADRRQQQNAGVTCTLRATCTSRVCPTRGGTEGWRFERGIDRPQPGAVVRLDKAAPRPSAASAAECGRTIRRPGRDSSLPACFRPKSALFVAALPDRSLNPRLMRAETGSGVQRVLQQPQTRRTSWTQAESWVTLPLEPVPQPPPVNTYAA